MGRNTQKIFFGGLTTKRGQVVKPPEPIDKQNKCYQSKNNGHKIYEPLKSKV